MPGVNLLGGCSECTDICGFALAWPDTIFVTFSAISGCMCQPDGIGGAFTFDDSGVNGTFTLMRIAPKQWRYVVNDPDLVSTFFDLLCVVPNTTAGTDLQFVVTATTSGSLCHMQIEIDYAPNAWSVFLATYNVPTDSPFSTRSNQNTMCGTGGLGSIIATGGNATISL